MSTENAPFPFDLRTWDAQAEGEAQDQALEGVPCRSAADQGPQCPMLSAMALASRIRVPLEFLLTSAI